VIPAIIFVGVARPSRRETAENGWIPPGTDFGMAVRVASLFTVALVLL
jgi:hypothetical protein